jgi:uncharacterized protein (TIGR02246 family)
MSSDTTSTAEYPRDLQAHLQQFDAAYIAAFDAGNADALAELFTDDVIVMNTFGRLVSGRSAIIVALKHSFDGPCQGATLQRTPQQTQRISEDVVVQLGTTRTTRKTDPPTYRDFTYTKVLVRQGNAWKMAVAQFANVEPARRKSS